MFKRMTMGLLVFLLAGPGFALAQTGIPDLSHSEAWLAYDGPEAPTIMVVPDGSGPSYTEAMLPDGTVVDCTIYLRLVDWGDYPIYMFPREDMWLEVADGGLAACLGGTVADVHTDEDGMTWWAQPSRAGGHSQAGLEVMVNGMAATNQTYDLHFNSPDINGDGEVNLADVTLFSQNFYQGYDFRSDLHRDGVLNLSDVGRLIQGLGDQCP